MRAAQGFPEAFNSLFEMQKFREVAELLVELGNLSILYLRCLSSSAVNSSLASLTFNSLFEMRREQQDGRRNGGHRDFQFSI